MRVVLGVSGGIAAYKACSLLRLFTENGHDVTVVPTRAALEFVGAATWAALSGKPARTDVFEDPAQVPHVRIGQQAELVVVAPATADLLAKAAAGLADDLLTNTLLTTRAPVVMAPAMHTEMWEHPATQANVATLRSRGIHVVDPASGRLTGADTGAGRLPEPEDLYAAALAVLEPPREQDLAGLHMVVTAGGTREPLDPVRFLGNRSSGKQGYAIAAAAAARGARVTLVAANAALPVPPGVTVVPVTTAVDLKDAVAASYPDADAIVMAAAVADFRPATYAAAKIKKTYPTAPAADAADGAEDAAASPSDEGAPGPTIELVRNPDILAGLVRRRGAGSRPVIVGFAAETGDADGTVVDHARAKLNRKGCDAIIANEVGVDKTFGQDVNTVHVLRRDSAHVRTVGPAAKSVVADAVCDVIRSLTERPAPPQ